MIFDLFADYQCRTFGDVDRIVQNEDISDVYTKIKLLAGALPYDDK